MITMKSKTALFLGTLYIPLLAANAGAQSAVSTESTDKKNEAIMEMTASGPQGIEVKIATSVVYPDGAKPDNMSGGIQSAEKGRLFQRTLEVKGNAAAGTNSKDIVCYGYDFVVEPLTDSDHPRFRVSFQPVSDEKWKRRQEAHGCTTVASLSGLPAPQTVALGDVIALEVLSNPQTGTKIIDQIQVRPAR
jgi:hypothetical protein